MSINSDNKFYSDEELIKGLNIDHKYFLKEIYTLNKNHCIKFMRMYSKNNLEEQELEDIYHEAILVLYESQLKVTFNLTCSIRTYLNSVCKNKILNTSKYKTRFIRQTENVQFEEDDDGNTYSWNNTINDKLEDIEDNADENILAIAKALEKLKNKGGRCFELITLFYYHKKSMNDIASKLGYTNSINAKSQKYKCIERLRQLTMSELKDNFKK